MRKSKYQKFYQTVRDAWYWSSLVKTTKNRLAVDICEKYDEEKNPYPRRLYRITTERDIFNDEKSTENLIIAFKQLLNS